MRLVRQLKCTKRFLRNNELAEDLSINLGQEEKDYEETTTAEEKMGNKGAKIGETY